jgi:hypothetical protein
MMYVALTHDHRIVDGREAVTFLRHVKAWSRSPPGSFWSCSPYVPPEPDLIVMSGPVAVAHRRDDHSRCSSTGEAILSNTAARRRVS